MQELGYDPNADTPPAKVGRRAAEAVLADCRDDGANEAGNFADTTGYQPADAVSAGRAGAQSVVRQGPAANDSEEPRHALLAGAREFRPFRPRRPEPPNGRGKSTC